MHNGLSGNDIMIVLSFFPNPHVYLVVGHFFPRRRQQVKHPSAEVVGVGFARDDPIAVEAEIVGILRVDALQNLERWFMCGRSELL